MKRSKDQPEPPRPLCACGSPGFFQVHLDVQELVLDRDAGISAKPYWSARYRNGTRVETIMCGKCVKTNVQIQFSAAAKIENGREVL